jgi:hypothetical protein
VFFQSYQSAAALGHHLQQNIVVLRVITNNVFLKKLSAVHCQPENSARQFSTLFRATELPSGSLFTWQAHGLALKLMALLL